MSKTPCTQGTLILGVKIALLLLACPSLWLPFVFLRFRFPVGCRQSFQRAGDFCQTVLIEGRQLSRQPEMKIIRQP